MCEEKRVLCLLFEGFEEIEALSCVDLLRRAGAGVTMASLGERLEVRGRSDIVVVANLLFEDVKGADGFEMLVVPGGPGVAGLRQDGRAAVLARTFFEAGKFVAAICAAPLVLKDAGCLSGKAHTAHFSAHEELGTVLPAERVVRDGQIITSRSAGTALDFALTLVECLYGKGKADAVSEAIMA